MIQSPQLLNFVPRAAAQNGYPQAGYFPAQSQNMQMPGVIYNYPASGSFPQEQPVKYNGVNIGIKNPQGNAPAGYGSPYINNGVYGGYGNPYGAPVQMPAQQQSRGQFNGVNIEIVNPQGMGQMPGAAPQMPVQQPVYPMMPAGFYPVQQPPLMPPPVYPMMPPQDNNMMQQMPQIPGLPPQMMQALNMPQQQMYALPEHAAEELHEPPQPKKMPESMKQPEVPEPDIQQEEPAPAPIIGTPVQPSSSINPETFAGRLKTADMDEQRAAIEEIAEKVKNSETDGPVLLDTQIFDALVNIINRDTSSLAGPSPEAMNLRKKDPADLTPAEREKTAPSPLEQAEINKQYALYTISYMQERLNNELEKRKGSPLELKDLPCIETVVDTAKSNQNPILRQGAIASLAHIARPEYKKYLDQIFEIAQSDEDERVRDAAAKAAKSLNG